MTKVSIMRLWVSFVLITTLAASLAGCSSTNSNTNSADEGASLAATTPIVVGVNPVAADQVANLLPQVATQPVILAFKSKYCHDCQQMTPHLEALKKANPDVSFVNVDVQYGKDNYGHLLDAFNPSTVPVVVVIAQGGQIISSTVGYQEADALAEQVGLVL